MIGMTSSGARGSTHVWFTRGRVHARTRARVHGLGMPLDLIDTHCHLDLEPLSAAVEAVLGRAEAAGVRQCVSIGTTLPASRANVELARRHSQIKVAVGLHPYEAAAVTDAVLAEIDALAADPAVVAIGEVGLDCYRGQAPIDVQQRALAGFLALARRRGLPVIIHCREAYDALLRALRREGSGPWRGVLHCASGPPGFIQAALDAGLHVSFAGNVTYPSAQPLRELVGLVPDQRLLIETDSPFLAPQPVRGRTNEPAHVAHTAEAIARLRGLEPAALAALTSRNARTLFGLPPPSPPAS